MVFFTSSNIFEFLTTLKFSWQVFLAVALILGDGLYNFLKILSITIINFYGRIKTKNLNAGQLSSP